MVANKDSGVVWDPTTCIFNRHLVIPGKKPFTKPASWTDFQFQKVIMLSPNRMFVMDSSTALISACHERRKERKKKESY